MWFPAVATRIRDLERRVADRGLAFRRWEARYTDRIHRLQTSIELDEPEMCSSCVSEYAAEAAA